MKKIPFSVFAGGLIFTLAMVLKFISDRYTVTRPGFPGYFSSGPRIWTRKDTK